MARKPPWLMPRRGGSLVMRPTVLAAIRGAWYDDPVENDAVELGKPPVELANDWTGVPAASGRSLAANADRLSASGEPTRPTG